MGRNLFRALIAKGLIRTPEKAPPEPAPRRRMLLERLEDRLLFDAGPVAPVDADAELAQQAAAAAAQEPMPLENSVAEPAEVRVIDKLDDVQEMIADLVGQPVDGAEPAVDPNQAPNDSPNHAGTLDTDELAQQLLTTSDELRSEVNAATADTQQDLASSSATLDTNSSIVTRHEIAFVDTSVSDYQALVEGILDHSDQYRQIEVVLINAGEDGLAKIAETMRSLDGIDAIHLVSHGGSGVLQLGQARLTLDSMSGAYANSLIEIGQHLSADADILVYGCDFAAGDTGRAAVDFLSQITGADVSASDDATGNVALGGDWVLEQHVGTIESLVAVNAVTQADWQSLLAILDWDAVDWTSGALSGSYTVGGGTISLSLSGSTDDLQAGSPDDETTNTGGLSPIQESLFLYVNYQAQTTIGDEAITTTINFSHPGGVSNVSFSIFDIDNGGFTDQILVTANNGATINPSSVTHGSANTFDGTNMITGSASNDSSSANGNATFTFNQSGITQITIVYRSGQLADPSQQYISLHDISWNDAPKLDLDASSTAASAADNFSSGTYSGNSAGAPVIPWNGSWTENDPNDGANSTSAGDVQIISGEVRISDVATGTGVSILRAIDLSSYTSGYINQQLSFNYSTGSGVDTSDAIAVQVSSNGGTSWTTLENFTNISGTSSGSRTYSISDYATANTQVRFVVTSGYNGSNEYFGVDNVVISAQPTGFSNTFTEDGAGVAIADTDSLITDADSTNMSRATITLTNPQTSDLLSVSGSLPSGISLDPSSTSTTLILTGSSSMANYETAIEQIRFSNSSQNPNTTTRSITVVVKDDYSTSSNTATATISVVAVNDAPDAVNDSFTTNEDTAVAISVLANDTDPEGNSLTITQVNGTAITAGGAAVAVTNGSVTLNGAGTQLTFTPTANYNGAASFTYTISDGNGGTDTATVSGTVTAVNDPPVAVNDSFTTAEDTPVAISVKSNDSDVDGNPLTITQVNGTAITAGGAAVGVTNGSVTLNAAGTQLTFTPTANYNGAASFTYTISDGNGGTASATVSGTVTAVNDPPVAVNDSFTTNEDTSVAISVKSNDSDVDGDAITITQVNGTAITAGGAAVAVTNGSVALNAAGTQLTFTPTANYNGAASFTYTISDGNGGTASATVSGTVTAVNDPPVAVNDSFTTAEDTPVAISVKSNDSDVDGNPLSITQVNGTAITAGGAAVAVTNGSVTLNAAGTQLTFTPSLNYNGAASFTYTISDGNGGTASATVSGTVTAVNDPPVAVNDSFTTNEDAPVAVSVKSNDSDVDGDALTITQVNGTAIAAGGAAVAVTNGSVTLNAAGTQLTFTPTANYNGAASFTYTISDGNGGTATATVSGTVTAVNDPPVAVNDSFTTAEDTPVAISVKSNDSDIDGDTLTITQVNGTAITAGGAAVSVTNGSVMLNAAGTQLTFTPTANYNGAASFTYTISDGNGGTATATASGTVTAVNDPPVAVNDSFTTAEDTPVAISVKSNDSDADGDTLTITQVNGTAITAGGAAVTVTNGSVTLNAAGTQLTFTPTANYNGAESFTYTISDGNGGTATATVSGTVTAVDDPPVAVNDSFTTNEDTPVAISVKSNDSDVDGDTLTITQVNGTAITAGGAAIVVTNGSVTLNAAGTQLTFSPNPNYNGPASFTYTISDGNGGTATATVSGTVAAINDPPVAVNDSFTTAEDTPVAISVKSNDSDVDGDTLTITQVNGTAITAGGSAVAVTNGSVTLNAAGTQLTITPSLNYNGPASFTYTISDGNGGTATATVSGTVTAVNDPPVAVNDLFTTAEDTPVAISVKSNDSDADGDTLTITQVNGTAITAGGAAVAVTSGSVTLDGAGTQLTFSPNLNYNGPASFTYTISDGNGGTATATVSGTVTAVNDPPVAIDDSFTTAEDTPVAISVKSNDSDVDGDTLTITLVNGAAITAGGSAVAVTNGSVTLNGAGTQLTFTPSLNYNGPASFTYTISDGNGGTDTATVSGTITAVNDAPTTSDNAVSMLQNSSYTFDASDFPFSDVDAGDSLQSVRITSLPSVGSLTLGGVAVSVNQVIPVTNLGNLVFTPVVNQNGSPYTTFNFQVSDGSAFSNTATMTLNVVAVPELSVTVDDGGITATANDTVVYSLNYANNGMQNATGVYLLETVPTGSTFNAAASSLGWVNIGGDDYRLDIGSLPIGTSGTALFAVTVNSAIAAGQTQLVNSASIADDGTHGADADATNNTSGDTTPLNVAPNLQLTKSDGTSAVMPGASVVYSLGYANNGTQDATGVILTETLPTGATFDAASSSVGWSFVSGSTYQFNIGDVAVGSSGTLLFAVTIDSPATSGQGDIVNSATITDDGTNGPDEDPGDNSPTDTDTLNAQPDYQLTLSDAVASVIAGQSVTYTVTITNAGDQDGTGVIVSGLFPNAVLHNVVVTGGGIVDETSGTITWNVGNFAVGALQTFTITADVWPTLAAGLDDYTVSASITDDLANGSDPTPANNSASDTNTLDAAPDLRVTKTDFSNSTTPGSCTVYSVSVSNVGTQAATNVIVTETVPVGTTFNSTLSDPLWTLVAPNTYQITIANLAAGASFNIDFDVDVTSPAASGQTDIVNTVTITDDGTNGPDEDPSDNTGTDTNTLDAQPDYQITITDGETVVAPGQSLSYTISFTNTGDQDGSGVVVTDTFPIAILENVVASDGGIVDTITGTITWNVGTLAVGDSRTFTVTAKVRDSVPAGFDDFTHDTAIADDLSNGADSTPGNNSGSDTDTLDATPDYHIAITDGETAVAPGQSLSYTINFLNAGNQDGTGVIVSDTFPTAILENVVVSDGGIVDAVAGTITWNVGTLAAGESRSFTVTANVRSTIPAGFDDFTHATTITDDSANGTDPTPADNSADDTDTLNAQPDYQISIDDGVLSATTGQSVTYSVTFANAGLQDGTGVTVGTSFPLSVLTNVVASNGGIVDMTTGTITWNVGSLAAGATLTYTVTADVLSSVAAGIDDFTHSATITDDSANGADPTPANNSASDTDTLNAAPDLRITKTDFTSSISPGQGSVYTLNVSNIGTQEATNVLVTETVPVGTTFNSAFSDPAWTDLGGGIYQYAIASLAAGAGFNINFSILIESPAVSGQSDIVNTATIADDGTNGPDLDPTNDSATDTNTLDAVPNYSIGIDDLQTTIAPGQSVTYFVNFSNDGLQNGTGVVVTATFPTALLTNVIASNGGIVDTVAGTITWNVGNLTANDPHTFEITADVVATVPAGVSAVTLTASITDDGANGADPDLSDNTSSDTDTLNAQPDYAITIDDGETQVSPGDPLTYTINVANNGNQDGTGVVVTVSFPVTVLQNVVASSGGIVDAVAGTITWNIGDLNAGDSTTLAVSTQVRSTINSSTPTLTLTATVTDDGANGADPTPLNNTSRDLDQLQLYAYDSFHDWKDMRFGFLAPQQFSVGRPLAPLPVDPVFSGLTEPGSTLVARIYSADGRLLGDRQVVADSGGNWLVTFPNLIIYEYPHRMEIIVTPAVNNLAHENGFNLRRYFHPAIHAGLVMTEPLSVAGVFRNRAYNIVEAQHSANTHPLGFQWYSHAYELNAASSNVSQM